MQFSHPLEANTYTNDPKGFKMPYARYGKLDEERLMWRYYRLTNFPTRGNKIRCNNHVFGNCERRLIGVRF